MIKIKDLGKEDIGRWVSYNDGRCRHKKCGMIKDWDIDSIDVLLEGQGNVVKISPRWLSFCDSSIFDGLESVGLEAIARGEEFVVINRMAKRFESIRRYCENKIEGHIVYIDTMKAAKEKKHNEDILDRIDMNICEAENQMLGLEWILEKCNEVLGYESKRTGESDKREETEKEL